MNIWKKYKALSVVILLIFLFASFGIAAERKFHARLTGGEVVGQVHTSAHGDADFQLSKSGDQLTYKLTVRNIKNVSAAHIHQGKHGENGPPVVSLFSGTKKTGEFGGVLSEGTIAAKDLIGSLKGKPLGSLMQMIEDKDAYVNVHTERYPDGEIRGQIKP
jgi:hypothetical protein